MAIRAAWFRSLPSMQGGLLGSGLLDFYHTLSRFFKVGMKDERHCVNIRVAH
jgi:hypothetical protein